ncbi:MAG: hypothetical protein V1719_00480 [Patescibacteria group bacterium]
MLRSFKYDSEGFPYAYRILRQLELRADNFDEWEVLVKGIYWRAPIAIGGDDGRRLSIVRKRAREEMKISAKTIDQKCRLLLIDEIGPSDPDLIRNIGNMIRTPEDWLEALPYIRSLEDLGSEILDNIRVNIDNYDPIQLYEQAKAAHLEDVDFGLWEMVLDRKFSAKDKK